MPLDTFNISNRINSGFSGGRYNTSTKIDFDLGKKCR